MIWVQEKVSPPIWGKPIYASLHFSQNQGTCSSLLLHVQCALTSFLYNFYSISEEAGHRHQAKITFVLSNNNWSLCQLGFWQTKAHSNMIMNMPTNMITQILGKCTPYHNYDYTWRQLLPETDNCFYSTSGNVFQPHTFKHMNLESKLNGFQILSDLKTLVQQGFFQRSPLNHTSVGGGTSDHTTIYVFTVLQ